MDLLGITKWLEQYRHGYQNLTHLQFSWGSAIYPRFAIFLNTAGGAWDNAKKYIEQGWQLAVEKRDCIYGNLLHFAKWTIIFFTFKSSGKWPCSNMFNVFVKWPEGNFWEPWQWKTLEQFLFVIIRPWLSRWVIPERSIPTIYWMPSIIPSKLTNRWISYWTCRFSIATSICTICASGKIRKCFNSCAPKTSPWDRALETPAVGSLNNGSNLAGSSSKSCCKSLCLWVSWNISLKPNQWLMPVSFYILQIPVEQRHSKHPRLARCSRRKR